MKKGLFSPVFLIIRRQTKFTNAKKSSTIMQLNKLYSLRAKGKEQKFCSNTAFPAPSV